MKYRDLTVKELLSIQIGLDTDSEWSEDDGLEWFDVFVKTPKGVYAQFFDEADNGDVLHPLRMKCGTEN